MEGADMIASVNLVGGMRMAGTVPVKSLGIEIRRNMSRGIKTISCPVCRRIVLLVLP